MDILELHAQAINTLLSLAITYSKMAETHAKIEEYELAIDYDQKAMASLTDAMHILKKHII